MNETTKAFSRITALAIFLALFVVPVFSQTSTTGSIAGAVTDPTGAVVAGAQVVVKNNGTGVESTVTTSDNGTFNVPSLATGVYTVTIQAAGFKQMVVTEVKVDVAKASSVTVQLEIGAPTETVTVVGSAELLQTQSANVASTITGRQITDLPYASRNALDVVLFLPGTSTVGRPRQSSVNGLPKGALNITLDGVQVQDPLLKNSDGFFTYIQPKTDAIEEVTLSTATPGAESAGAGAVQIKFATRQGTSEYHGSAYIYHRNSWFNSNYWFNNRDLAEDPVDHKAPRARVLLTQPGVRIGGPILIPGILKSRDKAFFFVNYEEYRLPEATARQRTVFNPAVLNGTFTYIPSGSSTPVVRNLFTLAAATDCNTSVAGLQPCPSTIDPTIGSLLNEINATTSIGGLRTTTDPNLNQLSFINAGGQTRRFPTVNLTFNLTKNHQLTNVWNYQQFRSVVDFLNNADPRFPGFPNFGSQASNRFSNSTALISKFGGSISNEARFSLVGGTVVFFPELSLSQFANQAGFNLGINAGGITSATAVNTPQRRNSPVQTFSDSLNWSKGNHSWTFGGTYTQTNLFSKFAAGNLARTVTLGIDQTNQGGDPANAFFNNTNFPGASTTQLNNARGIYATLVGRMTQVSGTAVADEDLHYTLNGDLIERAGQKAWAAFAQDSWRIRPNLTLNFGLRYELQGPYYAKNNAYTVPLNFDNIYGCSGPNNFFHPSACTSPKTQVVRLEPGSKAYNTDRNNFAPNFGFAYSPDFKSDFLRRIFGESGQSVIRAGYSIAYNQDGTNVGSTGLGTNPGQFFSVSASTANGGLPIGSLFRTPGSIPNPAITAPTFPYTPSPTNEQAVAFSPNLRVGYVQSWTFGVQREIMRDTVFEARYVGNRAKKLTRLWSINEVNTIENGFGAEYKLAQANLLANNASGISARRGSFAYFGTGSNTSPLPIFLAYINGSTNFNTASAYTGSSWTSTAIANNLVPVAASVTGAAAQLSGSATFRANAIAAGLQRNFFVVNPDMANGAFIIDNSASSTYDAMQLELRRRMSAGLLLQASYTWSHALSDAFASSSIAQSNFTSIRNPRLNYGNAPFDIRHSFKGDFIYELPFGRGQRFASDIGTKSNWLIGGWGVNGTFRIQSGSPINFGNVQLVNMTRSDLQKMIEIQKNPTTVTWLPNDVILNTIRAWSTSTTSATGYSGLAPDLTKPFIAPPGFGNCQAGHNGQCGINQLIIYGPRFTRIDASLVKRLTFSEAKNLEFRVEALNVINNQNFKIGSFANDVTNLAAAGYSDPTFGQTTVAYQDTSTTTDPGGRVIQFVLRFNF